MRDVEAVEVTTGTAVTGSVIWLHGLGADGHDFEPIVPELDLPEAPALRFVFPHAPVRPVTINGGMAMRSWFDIVSLGMSGPVDAAGIDESCALLESLIESERERGVAPSRIVVAGFSQGGAIAIHTVARYPERLAGLIGLSTYLPMPERFAADVADNSALADRRLPVFMAHGTLDPLLPCRFGRASADQLRSAGLEVEWREYPMAHAVCPQEIADVSGFLSRIFSDAK